MITATEERIRADWWLRAQVLVAALAAAIGTVAIPVWSSAAAPIAVICFVVVGIPLAFSQPSQSRTACRVVGLVLLGICVLGFGYAWVYALFYVMPLLIALCALIGIGCAADEQTQPVPAAARIGLAVIAVSVALAFTEMTHLSPQDRTPIGMAAFGALALLPLAFRDRLGFRIAGIVAGAGLLVAYLGQPAATPVLAAGVAVVLTCCGESSTTRVIALVAAGVGWLIPLLILMSLIR